jgi:hypothetical protein
MSVEPTIDTKATVLAAKDRSASAATVSLNWSAKAATERAE